MTDQHDPSAQIAIVCEGPQALSSDYCGIFSGWQWESLRGKMLRGGLIPERCQLFSLPDLPPSLPHNLIIGMGEKVLRHFTDKKGIDKWQLSPLETHAGQKFIPTFDMSRVQKQFELGLYQEMAFRRAFEEASSRTYERTAERFHLNPTLEETLAILEGIKDEPQIAVDVETGYGQINTVGFAWSSSDAVAINVLPDRCSDASYYELWCAIGRVLRGPSSKIFQNFIYDTSYFSAYGIRTENVAHDTMWAMKFLWPELKSSLGNVGRIYTKRPYWKDDGKTADEEGKKKDWGNVRDWTKHYLYNCRDTTGTWEAKQAQIEDLRRRGLLIPFTDYVMRLCEPISEMCARGMPVDPGVRERLRAESEARLGELTAAFTAEVGEVNPRSPKQILNYLRSLGVNIPKKYNKEKGIYQESTDAASIKKIRLKLPETKALANLQEIKTLEKALSSYINFDMRADSRLSYSLNGCGTETLRFCLRAGTKISIPSGDKNIEDMKVGDLVYCYDGDKNLRLEHVTQSGVSGYTNKFIRIHWSTKGKRTGFLDCTPEHKIRLLDGSYIEANKLLPGMRTLALCRWINNGYFKLGSHGAKVIEHRFVFSELNGVSPEIVHHKDHNKLNNSPDNLSGLSRDEHVRQHRLDDKRLPRKVLMHERARGERCGNAKLSADEVRDIKRLFLEGYSSLKIARMYGVTKSCITGIRSGHTWKHIELNNHRIERIEIITANESVYDISVSRWNNFIANEICVHNSGGTDAWDRGVNIQTLPREGGEVSIKQMFVAPEGFTFVEIDLRQAESRFVAYDSADKTLIDMLESGADVHTHVGKAILRQMGRDPEAIPKEEFKGTWRQLGKKAGHGLNYAMKAGVFVETVFNELDIVISKKDAELITAAYYGLFPGIPRWHKWIKNELYTKRKLTAPSGWERYFYGRPGDDMAKEAYAFRPQHTIPWIVNHLMFHLCDQRKRGNLNFHLLVQTHDSLTMLVPDGELAALARVALATEAWHPEVVLPGGRMIIPTEVKYGQTMATLTEWEDMDDGRREKETA